MPKPFNYFFIMHENSNNGALNCSQLIINEVFNLYSR
jgi:uncharacterized protein YycO